MGFAGAVFLCLLGLRRQKIIL
ncbi:MAG: GlyGly-CTERM sorting domain-containing protein [Ruminococcaceae bacterium]|nr:GlyGly-CTERM sorting domain-containing protein [Oscillospiraceae bacterium]